MALDAEPTPRAEPAHEPSPRELAGVELTTARCHALLRALTSIIWITDADGHCRSPQHAWSQYTGQVWPEHAGLGWLQAVHPEDRDALCEVFDAARAQGKPYVFQGRLWHAPSGAYRHFEVRGVPVADDAGRASEWIGTCKDIDDQRRAEAMLHDADRRKDEFIAILAHELRNPLAPIRNAVHVLKRRAGDDMQLAWVRNIVERQVGQMAHLLEDLLDVSRITQNKLVLNKSRVTLDSVLETAIETSRPLLEQHGHVLDVAVLDAPTYIDADPQRLAQAFVNLLTNAAKYTERGGRITLSVRRVNGSVCVSIKDNGIGIAPENLARIFELFRQAPSAQGRSLGGLGIGLAIVRALVDMHGGTVSAKSPGPGRGSEFTVTLPSAPARVSLPPRPAQHLQPPHRLKVLVADDNPDAAETLAVLMEMLGHEVTLALDGEQALAAARRQAFDVALLDIGMPKLSGYEVAEHLRRECPATRTVAITGWGQMEDLRRAAAAGFDRHLVKPVAPDQLEDLLGQLAHEAKRD